MSSVVAHKSSPWLISLRRVKTTPTLLPLRFMLLRSHVSRLSEWLSLIVATFFKRWHVHVARGAWTSHLKLILLLVNILHIKTKTLRRFQRLGIGTRKQLFVDKKYMMHLACKIYLWSFITLMKITYIIRTSSKFTYFAFLLLLNPYAFQSENESSKRGIGLQVPIVCHKCLDAELQNIQSCLFASNF